VFSRKDAGTEHPVARSPSPGNRPRVSKAEPARQQSGARFSAAEALPLSQGEHLSERPFTKPDLAAPAHGTPAGATGQGLVALVCVPGERGRRILVHDLRACGGCGAGSGVGIVGKLRGWFGPADWLFVDTRALWVPGRGNGGPPTLLFSALLNRCLIPESRCVTGGVDGVCVASVARVHVRRRRE